MRTPLIVIGSLVFGLWMGLSTWLFGFGGALTPWYLALIALPFILLNIAIAWRATYARKKGREPHRAMTVSIVLSWVTALLFGYTVPDETGNGMVSLLSYFSGDEYLGFSIGVCNPLGIITFILTVMALIIAIVAGVDPRPEDADDWEPEGGWAS